MAFDFKAFAAKVQALAASLQGWTGTLVKIAGPVARIYGAYKRLSPTTQASLLADLKTLVSTWHGLDEAFDAYDKDDGLTKIAAAETVADSLARAAPILGRIANDGATVFGADWAVIEPDFELILTTLKGTV